MIKDKLKYKDITQRFRNGYHYIRYNLLIHHRLIMKCIDIRWTMSMYTAYVIGKCWYNLSFVSVTYLNFISRSFRDERRENVPTLSANVSFFFSIIWRGVLLYCRKFKETCPSARITSSSRGNREKSNCPESIRRSRRRSPRFHACCATNVSMYVYNINPIAYELLCDESRRVEV